MDKNIVDKRINKVVKRFDMESFKNQKIGSLSTGQGVARCVYMIPIIIF